MSGRCVASANAAAQFGLPSASAQHVPAASEPESPAAARRRRALLAGAQVDGFASAAAPASSQARAATQTRAQVVADAIYNRRRDVSDQVDALPSDRLTVEVHTTPTPRKAEPNLLAISREWDNLEQYTQTDEALQAFSYLFLQLGPSPVMRVGGRSQEVLTAVPPLSAFVAMRTLRDAVGMRYIIGLPLEQRNVKLARDIMATAQSYLGNSIIAFELGNEPAIWDNNVGGWDADGKYGKGLGFYMSHFHRTARKLIPGCDARPAPLSAADPTSWWLTADNEIIPDRVPGGPGNPNGTLGPQPAVPSPTAPSSGGAAGRNAGNASNAINAAVKAARAAANAAAVDFAGDKVAFNAQGRLVAVPANARVAVNAAGAGRKLLARDAAATASASDAAAQGGTRAAAPNKPYIMGPSWHSLGLPPLMLKSMGQAGQCYMKEVTVHFYSHLGVGDASVDQILDENKLRGAVQRFKQLKDAAAQGGVALRVSETNSAVNGGAAGVSEVLGAALWTADTTFEFARAGATGVHMHWGVGGTTQGGGPAYTGVQTNFKGGNPNRPYPSVHAPWYGYLLYLTATRGDDVYFTNNFRQETPGACSRAVKVWSLVGYDPGQGMGMGSQPPGRSIRIALLNKNSDRSCTVELRVRGANPGARAQLRWLKSLGGIASTYGMTWAGQTFGGSDFGLPLNYPDVPEITPTGSSDGVVSYSVNVGAGRAVLFTSILSPS